MDIWYPTHTQPHGIHLCCVFRFRNTIGLNLLWWLLGRCPINLKQPYLEKQCYEFRKGPTFTLCKPYQSDYDSWSAKSGPIQTRIGGPINDSKFRGSGRRWRQWYLNLPKKMLLHLVL